MPIIKHINNMADLAVSINGIEFKNPVLTASGTFGYGEEFDDFLDLGHIGVWY